LLLSFPKTSECQTLCIVIVVLPMIKPIRHEDISKETITATRLEVVV